MTGVNLYRMGASQQDVEFRKQQLQQQQHVLTSEESKDLLWSTEEGVKEWLHRPVQVRGRPIHGKQMMVPRRVKGHLGYDCIVPLVTSEQEDGTQQYGMLLNMGWIPFEVKHVHQRLRLENADW